MWVCWGGDMAKQISAAHFCAIRNMTFFVIVMFAASLYAADFEGHKDFSAVSLAGRIEVRCLSASPGQPNWATHFCRADIIEAKNDATAGAFDMSYFNHQTPYDVDQFELTSLHADGSIEVKSGKFSALDARSKSWVNLWIDTLLQNPLLELGVNKVSYKLSKSGAVKESGEFSSEVTWVGERTCAAKTYFGQEDDCSNAQEFCDRYFREQNLCRQ